MVTDDAIVVNPSRRSRGRYQKPVIVVSVLTYADLNKNSGPVVVRTREVKKKKPKIKTSRVVCRCRYSLYGSSGCNDAVREVNN